MIYISIAVLVHYYLMWCFIILCDCSLFGHSMVCIVCFISLSHQKKMTSTSNYSTK